MEPDRPNSSAPQRSLPEAIVRTLRHEVGDLLQTVYSTVALLQQRLPAECELEQQLLARLRGRAQSCRYLLDTVHDLIGPLTLKCEWVDPAELLLTLAATAAAQHPHLQIQTQADQVPHIWADPPRIVQALTLLLKNACATAQRCVWLHTAPGGDAEAIQCMVSDDGPGVPADHLPQLFSPFLGPGLHLARIHLALAQKLVLLHGGQITAGNRPEGGFVVSCVLPVQNDLGERER